MSKMWRPWGETPIGKLTKAVITQLRNEDEITQVRLWLTEQGKIIKNPSGSDLELVVNGVDVIRELRTYPNCRFSGYSFQIFPAFHTLFKRHPLLRNLQAVDTILLYFLGSRTKVYTTLRAIQKSPKVTFNSRVIKEPGQKRNPRYARIIRELHGYLNPKY